MRQKLRLRDARKKIVEKLKKWNRNGLLKNSYS